MYKIIIKGEAKTDYPNLEELHGVDCQDEFVEYIEDDELRNKLKNGYMRFVHENGKLFTITEYHAHQELSEDELNILTEYTQGQWSDGIGEGFEQFPCMHGSKSYEGEEGEYTTEVYISPWFAGQTLVTSQSKI